MEAEVALRGLVAAAVSDWVGKLVAIPAGYAIGAWIGMTFALVAGYDRDSRTDVRDVMGSWGGAAGCVVWVWTSL